MPLLPGFDSHKSGHSNQNDGVVVYVRTGIECSILEPDIKDANGLVLSFSDKLAVLAIYRSPSYLNLGPFLESLDKILPSFQSFKSVAIIGDININIIASNTSSSVDEYLNFLASHALLPAHLFPTREGNCIDHVFARSQFLCKTFVLNSLITDHAPIIFSCSFPSHNMKVCNTYPRCNIPAIVNDLSNSDFSTILSCTDTDLASEKLINIVSAVVNRNTRTTNVPSRKRIIKPWITPGLLRCIRHKDKLYRIFRRNPANDTNKLVYTRYRNFCYNLLKKVKREYEQLEFQKVRNNPRAAWNMISRIANLKQNKNTASNLLNLSNTPSSSVDSVNSYFANVGKSLASKILPVNNFDTSTPHTSTRVPLNDPSSVPLNSMALFTIDDKEIDCVILSLKDKSALGWDGISTSVIKAARHILIPILNHIFNLSLTSGIFPRAFKKAIVHPIFKSGDRDSVTNYRPISVLTVFSKIYEKILNVRLINFINTNDILSKNQFGFRSGISTEDAVLELSNNIISNFEQRLQTVGVFLDLSKAFDTVSVPILLSKLHSIGIRGIALDLFSSYLSDREQCVVIENFKSSEETLSFGVPQGSVLGPTLFLIYINELCNLSLPCSKIITYADDTVLVVHGRGWEDARENCENSLRAVMGWLSANLLTINLSKTKAICFAPKTSSLPPPSFLIRAHSCSYHSVPDPCDCTPLVRSSFIKYLGVIVDDTMTWKHHIDSTVSRVRKLIFAFKSLRSIVDLDYLKNIYFALAQSILSYCIVAWGGSATSHMLRLERAQRAVLKVISRKPLRFPTTNLYVLCQVLTVRQLFVLQTVLKKHSELTFDRAFINLKRRSDLVCPTLRCRTAVAQRHYPYISAMLYNRLNKELQIYPVSSYTCKLNCSKWLQTLSYLATEDLLKVYS